MISILNEFKREMELLKLYIDFQNRSYANQAKIEQGQPDSILRDLTVSKIKQFDFNSHIISIYGAYENFVEQLLAKYLSLICSLIPNYRLLPDDIKKSNVKKSLEIIKNIDYRKNRNFKTEDLIETLHKNMSEDFSIVNIDAFKNHSANFKIAIVNSYFSEVGIKDVSNLVRNYEPLKTYVQDNIADASSRPNNIIFEKLEYICEIRNDIAHGVRSIELIDKSILFEHIDYMKIYCESLYELIQDSYFSTFYTEITEELDVIDIFNNKILCFHTKGKVISKNSKILVHSSSRTPQYFLANIKEIRHNNSVIDCTSEGDNIKIGISLDRRIKNTMKFKIIA